MNTPNTLCLCLSFFYEPTPKMKSDTGDKKLLTPSAVGSLGSNKRANLTTRVVFARNIDNVTAVVKRRKSWTPYCLSSTGTEGKKNILNHTKIQNTFTYFKKRIREDNAWKSYVNNLEGGGCRQALTSWRRNSFLILAHPVYKMWIIQEPNN